ncbi:hypothetical protein V8C86DRAFT_2767947 [Haematococcus lacustris]
MTGDGKRRGGGGDRGGGRGGGNNKKARYTPHVGSGQALPSGSRGLLVTCDNGWEDRTADDVRALVEEHYDKLVKAQGLDVSDSAAAEASTGEAAAGGAGEGSKDISALIAEEVAELKDKRKRRFQSHDTGVRGCVYIIFPASPPLPGPIEVAISLCEEAAARKVLRARHANRLLPITHISFAGLDEIKVMAPKMLAPAFPSGEGAQQILYAVEYEHRNAEKLERMDVINAFVNAIATPPHKVNLSAPALTVLVQRVRNACGASVLPKYRELHKFNLRKCAEVPEEGEEGDQAAAKAKAKSSKSTKPAATSAATTAGAAAAPTTGSDPTSAGAAAAEAAVEAGSAPEGASAQPSSQGPSPQVVAEAGSGAGAAAESKVETGEGAAAVPALDPVPDQATGAAAAEAGGAAEGPAQAGATAGGDTETVRQAGAEATGTA